MHVHFTIYLYILLLDSSDIPPVDLVAAFPYLKNSEMSDEELDHYRTKLHQETKAIKSKFDRLVSKLQQTVKKSYEVTDIAPSLKSHEEHFKKPLCECSSVSDVFDNAASIWSFYDYRIIKDLINQFGAQSDKDNLEKYKDIFRAYSKRRICECPNDAFGVQKKSEKCFALKTDENMNSLTLKQLKDLQFRMNRILGRKFLRLLSIEEGCVRLIFRSSSEDVMDLSPDQQMKLRRLRVLKVSYGERSMDMPELEVHDIASTKDDSEFHDRYKSSYCI